MVFSCKLYFLLISLVVSLTSGTLNSKSQSLLFFKHKPEFCLNLLKFQTKFGEDSKLLYYIIIIIIIIFIILLLLLLLFLFQYKKQVLLGHFQTGSHSPAQILTITFFYVITHTLGTVNADRELDCPSLPSSILTHMEDNQKVLVKKCFHATRRCFKKACKAVWERTSLMALFSKNISITVSEGKIRQNFHLNPVKTKLKWFSRCVPSEAVSSIISSFTLKG